ncbi:MAG: hypothetical protein L6V93_05335 [Clostridiales bacterium]|nr:MAG: hypothetical protein L6V93_05335 [Clostridiales bacterium]
MHKRKIYLPRIYFYVVKISYLFPNYKLERKSKAEKNGFEDAEYIKLRMLQNRHLNDRCFIVATGPSLTFEDLSLLKMKSVFGMNSICKILDKNRLAPNLFWNTRCFLFMKKIRKKEIKRKHKV